MTDGSQCIQGVVGSVWPGVDGEGRAGVGRVVCGGCTYQVTPFIEPMRERTTILEYWSHIAATQRDIQFGYEVLAVTEKLGIARWWASFVIVPQELQTKLGGIFVIALDAGGRCRSLREWWHKEQR